MNCLSCGAPMQPETDGFRCDYCKNVYIPEKNDDGIRLLGEASGQQCPICNIALMQGSLARTPVVYCTRCRGMLISMEAFQSLIQQLEDQPGAATIDTAAPNRDLSRKLNCPRCHRTMDAHFYAGPGNVVIDSCEHCMLVWLDHGELMRIVHEAENWATI